MATTAPGNVWMVGETNTDPDCGDCATVWYSGDGGQTFTKSLNLRPELPCTACNSIFYFVGVLNGTLYVQARDFYTVNNATTARMQSRAWAFDGHEWMPQGVALIPDNHAVQYGYQPVQFGNVLVYQSRQPTRTFSNTLYVFDSDSVKQA